MNTNKMLTLEFVEDAIPGKTLEYTLTVAKFPTTVAEFSEFVKAGGYQRADLWSARGWQWLQHTGFSCPRYWMSPNYDMPGQPVTGTSFWEAEAYARFREASLLNEHEWSLIASNGGKTRFPWGDEDDAADGQRANLGFFGEFAPSRITEVHDFPMGRSQGGVWDLLGNVSEWCLSGTALELQGAVGTAVLKGGCSWHAPTVVDASFRDEVLLATRDNQTGIRLVRRQKAAAIGETRPNDGFSIATTANYSAKRMAGGWGKARRPIARPTRPYRQEGIPAVNDAEWRLNITGLVHRPCELSLADLRQLPRTRCRGLFVCVCRWGQFNEAVGVLLSDLIRHVGVTADMADLFLRQRSVPGPNGLAYESTLSLAAAMDRGAILCYELDGSPLTSELGAPLRLIDFGVLGYKQVKCLKELHVTTNFEAGWWERECQYDPTGAIQPGTILIVGDSPSRMEISGPEKVTQPNR